MHDSSLLCLSAKVVSSMVNYTKYVCVNDIRSTIDVNESFNHQDDNHGNMLSKYKDIINTIKNEKQKNGHTHFNKTLTQLSLRSNKIIFFYIELSGDNCFL